jgi:hypothetical protein
MNLYLLFAIALGAIVPQAPAPRPFAAVVAKSGVRAEVEIRHSESRFAIRDSRFGVPILHRASVPARLTPPLTGAGTPRAPSA